MIYLYTTDKELLKKLSKYLTQFSYLPVPLLTLPFFTAANLMMLPIAYVFSLVHKVNILRIDNRTSRRKNAARLT